MNRYWFGTLPYKMSYSYLRASHILWSLRHPRDYKSTTSRSGILYIGIYFYILSSRRSTRIESPPRASRPFSRREGDFVFCLFHYPARLHGSDTARAWPVGFSTVRAAGLSSRVCQNVAAAGPWPLACLRTLFQRHEHRISKKPVCMTGRLAKLHRWKVVSQRRNCTDTYSLVHNGQRKDPNSPYGICLLLFVIKTR